MRYASLGEVPRKRHSQFRDDGRLLVEEVMGYEGFSGNESILYHTGSPCRIAEIGPLRPLERPVWAPDAHVHRLADLRGVEPSGDPVSLLLTPLLSLVLVARAIAPPAAAAAAALAS